MSLKEAHFSTPRGELIATDVTVCNYCGQMEMFSHSVRWINVSDRHFCSPEHEQAYRASSADRS